ncbi:alpha/beta hydrolase [Niabella ginsengisoli]|uniref:Alpha/beta hydrolase n=1 Tax=Niabella ginsengisoli TaxID=522298 RepID=A0ABS9SIQ9_9BACT|nr:alpha/beta hydrolase [Niabella ginsengisoli]MCH5598246.1 alpha/beta hydrolase [Niabella ginsengisoli]
MQKGLGFFLFFTLQLMTASAQQNTVEIVYKKIDTTSLKMKLYYPADYKKGTAYPTIVLFFGGGWNSGNMNQFKNQALYLASKGMIAVTPDYRVKKRQNTTPFESVKDGRSAIRYLRAHAKELGIDPDNWLLAAALRAAM